MRSDAWKRLPPPDPPSARGQWLGSLLERNARCDYLRAYGSPRTLAQFRSCVPPVRYEQLAPWMARVARAEEDVLFAGRPVGFERTAGSSGASKLVPYSPEGLSDFRRAVVPWLHDLVRRHAIDGSAYFSISPATRSPQRIGGIPVGMPDGAYLGAEAAAVLAEVTAVPLEVAGIASVDRWRAETLRYLVEACDLQLISVWSPTFLLGLLDHLPNPRKMWPALKVVSCWTCGASESFARELATRLPHAVIQPKGLLSTEAVVTVPDDRDRPVLVSEGFFEFESEGHLYLAHELLKDVSYEVIVTTASGLYRYRTGDLVRCEEPSLSGRPVLAFTGRGTLFCDLVGEKISEPFAAHCLATVPGFRFLAPDVDGRGYFLAAESGRLVDVADVERRLLSNPHYAYARRIGQLEPLRLRQFDRLFDRYSGALVATRVRLGDVKPVALRNERSWIPMLEAQG